MSKIYKKVHSICQPLIQAHSDELNTPDSTLMNTALKTVCATVAKIHDENIREAYVGYDLSSIESVIPEYVDTAALKFVIPEELNEAYKFIAFECQLTSTADEILVEHNEEFGEERDYSETDDREHFDDYGYVGYDHDIDEDNDEHYYCSDNDDSTSVFSSDVIWAVNDEASEAASPAYYRAILEYATYYLRKEDYLTAMSYINLIFTSKAGELSTIMKETWGTAVDWVEKKRWYYAVYSYIHEIKIIHDLLYRMHSYEKDEFSHYVSAVPEF